MNWLAFLRDLDFWLQNARHNHAAISRELVDVELETRLELESLGHWLGGASTEVEAMRAALEADLVEIVERGGA